MESARDSIKYARPVYTNTQNGNDLDDRTFGDWNKDGDVDLLGANYRKAMYETTEDRYVHEMANGHVVASIAADAYKIKGAAVPAMTGDDAYVVFGNKSFDKLGYIDGYSAIFGKDGEKDPLAVQAKTGGLKSLWMVKPGCGIEAVEATNTDGVFKLTLKEGTAEIPAQGTEGEDGYVPAVPAVPALDVADLKCYARFDSEGDFQGDYLGEVEIIMDDYWFQPRPTTIGVTWSQLTELVLDTSFGVSGEEMLIDYAGQEIKKALDFRAVKIAYQTAKMNGDKYTVVFDATAGNNSDDSYLQTAQTFSQAIERVGDLMYNDISRGGVSRIVGGPAAVSYLRLNSGFTTKGAQPRIGGHQVGELYGVPVFKVPSSVIPENELVCIWKNDETDADVAIAFGTLIPFFSTGVIQRKNLYKESALATYGDWQVLQAKYMGVIRIDNIRGVDAE